MTSKCSVCALPEQTREAIAGFLGNGVSLGEIAVRCGVTKSSLWRHSRHLTQGAGAEPAPKAETPVSSSSKPARPTKTVVSRSQETALAVPAPKTAAPEQPLDQEASRKHALDRAEQLWSELEECLRLAKEPTLIPRPDSTTLEVPVDLRTRSSVIRAGKDVIDLDARLNGLYDVQIPAAPRFGEVTFQNVILMPKTPECEARELAQFEARERAQSAAAKPEPTKPGQIVDALPEPEPPDEGKAGSKLLEGKR